MEKLNIKVLGEVFKGFFGINDENSIESDIENDGLNNAGLSEEDLKLLEAALKRAKGLEGRINEEETQNKKRINEIKGQVRKENVREEKEDKGRGERE